jgi:hypothetical protein
MTSSTPAQPIRIETLTPQIHGFIRAYVWQVYRGDEPVIDDDPAQQAALLVARAIVRLIGRDREMLRRLTQELGSYMGAMNPRKYEPSAAFRKLMAEFGGEPSSESAPAAAPAAPASSPAVQALVEPAPAHDTPAAPPVEVPTHVPAPRVEPAPAPVESTPVPTPVPAPIEVAPAHAPEAPEPAEAPQSEPVAEAAAVSTETAAVESTAETGAENGAAPSTESPSPDGRRRRKGRKGKAEAASASDAAGDPASDNDAAPQADGAQTDETPNS